MVIHQRHMMSDLCAKAWLAQTMKMRVHRDLVRLGPLLGHEQPGHWIESAKQWGVKQSGARNVSNRAYGLHHPIGREMQSGNPDIILFNIFWLEFTNRAWLKIQSANKRQSVIWNAQTGMNPIHWSSNRRLFLLHQDPEVLRARK